MNVIYGRKTGKRTKVFLPQNGEQWKRVFLVKSAEQNRMNF